MDLPSWFGKIEFYMTLTTVWFALSVYLLVTIIRVKKEIKPKESYVKLKSWWKERKKRKEEKHYN